MTTTKPYHFVMLKASSHIVFGGAYLIVVGIWVANSSSRYICILTREFVQINRMDALEQMVCGDLLLLLRARRRKR